MSSPTPPSPSVNQQQQPHHYISSYRARASLSRRAGAKAAAALSSSSSSSSTIDRPSLLGSLDPCLRLQTLLKTRYRHVCDDRPPVPWCPDFQPPIGKLIFSLARDSSWEKGTSTPRQQQQQRPSLRRIPLPGIFAEDRVIANNRLKFLKTFIINAVSIVIKEGGSIEIVWSKDSYHGRDRLRQDDASTPSPA